MTTVIDIGAQKIQHVGSSWSFGSNHYSSSQFPKVSIGIRVNESPSTCLRQRNGNDFRKSISCQSTAEDPKSGIEGPVDRKMSYDVADKTASTPTWFSTRSVHADIPIYETGKSYANKSKEVDVHTKNNILACDGRREKGESGKRTEEVKVQDKVNKGSSANEQGGANIFKSSNFNNCAVASREEATFPTKQEMDKKNEADTNCKNSSLKMKLWEILGNTPSENRQNADCPVATQESNLGRSKLPSPEPYANKDNVDAYQTNQFKKDRDSNEFKKNICGNGLKKDKNNNDAYQTNEFKKGNDSNEFRKVICGNGPKKDKNSNALQKDKNNSDFKKVNTSIEFKKSNADSSAKTRLQQLKGNMDLKRNLNGEFKKLKRPKNNKNSDTIEDDSESPNQDIKRPVTRSSTRKKASPKRLEKMKSIATKRNLSSSFKAGFKLESEKNNVFTFDEVEAKARGSDSSSGHSSRKSLEKNGEQNNNNHELPKVHISKCYSAKSMQNNEKKLESESINKSSFEFMKKENASVKNQDNGKCSKLLDDSIPNSQKAVKQNFGIPLSNACSPLFQKNPHPWGQQDSPTVHKNVFLHEEYVPYSAMEKKNNRWADEHSPTFAAYTSPTSPNVLNTEDLSTPLTENIKRSKALHTSSSESSQPNTDVSPESCQPDSDAESEQVKDDYQASHKAEDKESLLMNGNREKRNFTFSQMEEVKEDSESQDDDLSGKKRGLPSDFGLANKWFPSPEKSHESSPISLPKAKKARRLSNVKSSTMMNHQTMPTSSTDFGLANKWFPSPEKSHESSPVSLPKAKKARRLSNVKSSTMMNLPTLPTSSTESEGIVGLHEGLKQFPESGLGRCFAQLALALGRYKIRIKSKADKKRLEIMSAAADNIKQQLQHFRSQMIDDIGEFTTASKSKRKRLESKLQEEQEMLKLLHEKFRDEVNQHLSNCKTVLDETEALNKELKVSADRQKASHRKLTQQVEEAIGAQLNSAEANIAAVQKDAQKKMNSLKRMLKAYDVGTPVEN